MATDYKYFFAEYQIKREFSKPVRTFVLSGKDKSIVTEFENNLRKIHSANHIARISLTEVTEEAYTSLKLQSKTNISNGGCLKTKDFVSNFCKDYAVILSGKDKSVEQ